jgi:hypothetical protein
MLARIVSPIDEAQRRAILRALEILDQTKVTS